MDPFVTHFEAFFTPLCTRCNGTNLIYVFTGHGQISFVVLCDRAQIKKGQSFYLLYNSFRRIVRFMELGMHEIKPYLDLLGVVMAFFEPFNGNPKVTGQKPLQFIEDCLMDL